MCGICGIVNFDKSNSVKEHQIKLMTDRLVHRGPDDEGINIFNNVGLGFRRLSIIDLETGNQPIQNEQGNKWIVFNGEIYNYRELRKLLVEKRHKFRTQSDTEVVLHLYEEYGFDAPTYLRGMFAFCIWDRENNLLFCARDRVGIKPFFYSLDYNSFTFASEIKSILACGIYKHQISSDALNEYFSYGYISNDCSIYKSINKLEPAHSLVVELDKPGKIKLNKYWEVKYDPIFDKSENYWIDTINEVLTESVKMHMVSDVPIGAFLSGGIDSSTVVSMMSNQSTNQIKTFSIGFKEEKYNELKYADEIAIKYNTDHHVKIIEPKSIEILPELVDAYDEPFADSSAIPTYYVSKFAQEFVKVVLSGDGGDELFGGYTHYDRFIRIANNILLPNSVSRNFFSLLTKVLPDRVKGKKLLYYLSKNEISAYAYAGIWHTYEREKLYKDDFKLTLGIEPEYKRAKQLVNFFNGDILSALQLSDLNNYLSNDILFKVDIASMINSLEVRVPLLDHKLIELAFRIPSIYKIKQTEKKYILKKTISSLLPENIINHKKQGFVIPFARWFKEDLTTYILDKLTHSSQIFDYLDRKYVNEILAIHKAGYRDFSGKIWSLIFLDAWLDKNKKYSKI